MAPLALLRHEFHPIATARPSSKVIKCERPAGERHISELAITIEESRHFDGLPQGVETGATGFVDGRLAEENVGTPEAMATRLTRLLSDSLAALGKTPTAGALALRNGRPR